MYKKLVASGIILLILGFLIALNVEEIRTHIELYHLLLLGHIRGR